MRGIPLFIHNSGYDKHNYGSVFHSYDDGVTWREEKPSPVLPRRVTQFCERSKQSRQTSHQNTVHYRVILDEAVQMSTDDGRNWQEAVDLSWITSYWRWHDINPGSVCFPWATPGPKNIAIAPTTDTIFVAMGLDGVLRQETDGEWQWIKVGEYELEGVANVDVNLAQLTPIWLLGVVAAISTVTIIMGFIDKLFFTTLCAIMGWTILLFTLLPLRITAYPTNLNHFVVRIFFDINPLGISVYGALAMIFPAKLIHYIYLKHKKLIRFFRYDLIMIGIFAFGALTIPFYQWSIHSNADDIHLVKLWALLYVLVVQISASIYIFRRIRRIKSITKSPMTGSS